MEIDESPPSPLRGVRRQMRQRQPHMAATSQDERGVILLESAGSDSDRTSRFAELVDRLAGGYKTISQLVYEVLKEAVVSGTFAPGEWLRQEWLANAIGVSRIPVRTALVQLESEGLVELHPHRGARVRTLTPAQINEIFRLRALLESQALQRSMAHMTPSRIAKVQALAEQLDAQGEGSAFVDARVRFYRELYDEHDNPLLVQMIEELRSHLGRYLLGFRVDHSQGHHQHTELVKYVANNDVAGAEEWLHTHLEEVRTRIEALVMESGYGEAEGGADDQRTAVEKAGT